MTAGDFYVMTKKFNVNGSEGFLAHSFADAERRALEELKNPENQKIWIEEVDKVYRDHDGCYEDLDSHVVKTYKN